MLLILASFTLSVVTRKPVTMYLKERRRPCSIYRSLKNSILEFQKNGVTPESIFSQLMQCCQKLPGYDQPICSIMLTQHFDELFSVNVDFGEIANICNENFDGMKENPILSRLIKTIPNKPRAITLKKFDCSVCEMIMGFALETCSGLSMKPAYVAFQQMCATIPEFKNDCSKFTEEVIGKMVEFVAKNMNSYEVCTFYNQC